MSIAMHIVIVMHQTNLRKIFDKKKENIWGMYEFYVVIQIL